jgi:hypothetical protein
MMPRATSKPRRSHLPVALDRKPRFPLDHARDTPDGEVIDVPSRVPRLPVEVDNAPERIAEAVRTPEHVEEQPRGHVVLVPKPRPAGEFRGCCLLRH